MTRRDMCYMVGKRGARLTGKRAEKAWECLCRQVEALGEKDMPKYFDLLVAIRAATLASIKLVPKEKR